jgi:peroxiredoxin
MKKNKLFYFVCLLLLGIIISCGKKGELKQGVWRGAIQVNPDNKLEEVPFIFNVSKSPEGAFTAIFTSAGEEIKADEIQIINDSVYIQMPVFQDKIVACFGTDTLKGYYLHFGSKSSYSMPFYAVFGVNERFPGTNEPPAANLTGRWKTQLGDKPEDSELMIGEFKQEGNKLTGTFLATGGDMRYLEGKISGNKLMMSGFDGIHTLIFNGEIANDTSIIKGTLCGGPTWKSNWNAIKDSLVVLPPADTLTYLKKGFDGISFSFPNAEGKNVSLKDERYKNKVVVLQIMGTWCPNCMDESRMLAGFYADYKDKGLDVIGLCFENDDIEFSKKRMEKFRNALKIDYEFLYAGTPKKTAEALPMLNRVAAFPTAIYIDKKGTVRKIHTGFSGPGTGENYIKLKEETKNYIEALLKE